MRTNKSTLYFCAMDNCSFCGGAVGAGGCSCNNSPSREPVTLRLGAVQQTQSPIVGYLKTARGGPFSCIFTLVLALMVIENVLISRTVQPVTAASTSPSTGSLSCQHVTQRAHQDQPSLAPRIGSRSQGRRHEGTFWLSPR